MPRVPRISPLRAAVFCLLPLWLGTARGGEVRTMGGEVYEGTLRLENGAVSVAPAGQPAQRVEWPNVLRASFQEKGKEQVLDGLNPGVQLRNGTLVGGRVQGIDAAAVHLNLGQQTRDFPLNTVARIVFARVPEVEARKLPAGFVGAVLPGGDLYEGESRGTDEHLPVVKVNSPLLGVRRFNYQTGEVLAVALRDPVPAAPEAYRVLVLGGSRYGVAALQTSVAGVSLRDAQAGDAEIPAARVAEISAGPDRVQPVGALRAVTVGSANPAKVPAAFTADALPAGGPIILAGQACEGGIVQAAGVAVTFPMPAGFSVFMARVGLPEGAPAGAAVVYSLAADGRPVWRGQPVAAGAGPVPVRWNLGAGVRTVTLYVEPAQPAALGTVAAWADAVLLKP